MNDSRTQSNNKLLSPNISENIFLVFSTNSCISLQLLYLKQVLFFKSKHNPCSSQIIITRKLIVFMKSFECTSRKPRLLDRDMYAQSLSLRVLNPPLFNTSFCIIGKFDYEPNFCIVKLIQPFLISNWLALHHD